MDLICNVLVGKAYPGNQAAAGSQTGTARHCGEQSVCPWVWFRRPVLGKPRTCSCLDLSAQFRVLAGAGCFPGAVRLLPWYSMAARLPLSAIPWAGHAATPPAVSVGRIALRAAVGKAERGRVSTAPDGVPGADGCLATPDRQCKGGQERGQDTS